MDKQSAPTRGGQAVRSTLTGVIGITTSDPKVRSGKIGVQFVGHPYDVQVPVEELEVIQIAEVTA